MTTGTLSTGPAYSVSMPAELSIMAMFESAIAASGAVAGGSGTAGGAAGVTGKVGRGSTATGGGATSGKTVFLSALEARGDLATFCPGSTASCLQTGHLQAWPASESASPHL